MKELCVLLSMVFIAELAHADIYARSKTTPTMLMTTPCLITQYGKYSEGYPKVRQAMSVVNRQPVDACWMATPSESTIYIVFDNPTGRELPETDFALEPKFQSEPLGKRFFRDAAKDKAITAKLKVPG